MRIAQVVGASLFAAALGGCGGSQQATLPALTGRGPALSSARLSPASAEGGALAAAAFETVYTFRGGTDGAGPQAKMIDENGTLFGTTHDGGTSGEGTVFTFSPTTGAEAVIYSFKGGSDGLWPETALLKVDGSLYGTTSAAPEGGFPNGNGSGTVFTISTKGREHVLHAFAGVPDGANPEGALIEAGDLLYGTTIAGGTGSCRVGTAAGCGTIYSVNPATGAESVVYSFAGGADGEAPRGGLVDDNGIFYGTTYYGGVNGNGTIYSLNPLTGAESVVYRFKGAPDGSHPQSSMTLVNGILYGTTDQGGRDGTAFSFNLSTGAEAVLADVSGGPECGLIPIDDTPGTLYGTESGDGSSGAGGVYSVNVSTGKETLLQNFTGGPNGASPEGGLVGYGGTIYGTTRLAGANGVGTIFMIKP